MAFLDVADGQALAVHPFLPCPGRRLRREAQRNLRGFIVHIVENILPLAEGIERDTARTDEAHAQFLEEEAADGVEHGLRQPQQVVAVVGQVEDIHLAFHVGRGQEDAEVRVLAHERHLAHVRPRRELDFREGEGTGRLDRLGVPETLADAEGR